MSSLSGSHVDWNTQSQFRRQDINIELQGNRVPLILLLVHLLDLGLLWMDLC